MLWNAFTLALGEIRRNLMRSFLTILGIIIGVASVIVMVTIGSGATAQVASQFESLGSNLLIIRPGQRHGQRHSAPQFDVDDAEAISQQVAAVRAASPQSSSSLTAIYGNQNWPTSVTGITEGFFTVREWPVTLGRTFTIGEYRAGKTACVIGATVRKELFASLDPIGENIRLGKLSCEVVGVLQAKGSTVGRDQDDLVVMPLRAFQRRVSGVTDVSTIMVSVHKGVPTGTAIRDIEYLLRERRHISPGEEDNFTVLDMKEIVDMLSGTTQTLTFLLGAVASVSLLVGGIGIMNIMLVSVTERTREIGIRLAIGALERDVLLQFLVEAVVMSSLGGVIGIVLALGASFWIALTMNVPFTPSLGIIALAFFFSATVGVVFGYFPARRAAHLDPIEALRHE